MEFSNVWCESRRATGAGSPVLPIVVTTGIKPRSQSPVHLFQPCDLGLSNLHLPTSVWYSCNWNAPPPPPLLCRIGIGICGLLFHPRPPHLGTASTTAPKHHHLRCNQFGFGLDCLTPNTLSSLLQLVCFWFGLNPKHIIIFVTISLLLDCFEPRTHRHLRHNWLSFGFAKLLLHELDDI